MKRLSGARPVLRALAAAILVMASTFSSPSFVTAVVHASPEAKKHSSSSGGSGDYLDNLLNEINARRAMVGTPPVEYASSDVNQAVGDYLADLTPQMEAMNSCFHGQYNPVAPAWDYVAAAGLEGEAHGEVLGCPDDSGYWTTSRIADGWWNSPSHFEELYGDPDVNVVACGTYGPLRGGQAFVTIACVTYHV